MTLNEFNTLPEDQQRDCWMTQGRYLLTRFVDQFALNLYAVDTFFVEVWYDHKANRIHGVLSFASINALDEYLPYIRLEI